MKKTYDMKIAGLDRSLPLCAVSEDLSIAAFILFGDVEITVASAAALLEKAPAFDVLVTAEAKSIPLIHEMARQSGHNGYIVARKGPKVYMTNAITVEMRSITTQHVQTLSIGAQEASQLAGKLYDRVYYNTDKYAYTFNVQDIEPLCTVGSIKNRFVPVVINYLPDNTSWILVDQEQS